MKQIFHTNDKVFDISHGWGNIKGHSIIEVYPVAVKFESGETRFYTADGKRHANDKYPSLSFTDYSGDQPLSHERPWTPKISEMVLFSNHADKPVDEWFVGFYAGKSKNGNSLRSSKQKLVGIALPWKYVRPLTDLIQ